MTPKKVLFFSLFFLISCLQLHAYDYLYVSDPQFWDQDEGTIEKAEFTIHPRGIYMEVGMYLTLSAEDTWFNGSENPLEIVLDFDLPRNSMVTDSWLWINEDIIQADIKDRWSAAAIYNDIVGRRQDPSILFKQSDTQYQLRVFPLAADSTRRVKVTYLVPGDWSDGQVSIPLPVGLLKTSKNPIKKIQVQSFLSSDFTNPRITQLAQIPFKNTNHATLGKHQIMEIPFDQLGSSLDFVLDVPTMQNGVFLSRFEDEEESYYQLALLPKTAMDLQATNGKKVAVLVDYNLNNSSVEKSEILAAIETQLIQSLAPTDSFNVLLSSTDISPLREEWLAGDEETIRAYFKLLTDRPLSNFSNLTNLFIKGIEYVQQQGTGGELLVVSNADQLGEPEIANVFIEELQGLMRENTIPIYVADYQDQSRQYYWVNGAQYRGNQYLYTNITRLTSGSLSMITENNSLSKTLQQSFSAVAALQGILDIHTTLQDGFCYGRYTIQGTDNFSAVNQAFLQVGKYQGDFPFEIEASGVINDQFVGNRLKVEEQNTGIGTAMDKIIWAGNYIQSLERGDRTNASIKEIIEWSLANRVLSFYTAFLALEVSRGGVVCTNCIDETNLLLTVVDNEEGGGQGTSTTDTDTSIDDPIRTDTSLDGDVAVDDIQNEGGGGTTTGGATGGAGPVSEPAPGIPEGDVAVATNDIALDTLLQIQATPNPFSEQTTITVQLGKDIDTDDLAFGIYGLDGRKVKTFAARPLTNDKRYQFHWNGSNEQGQVLPKGVYIFNVQTKLGQKNLKLLFVQ